MKETWRLLIPAVLAASLIVIDSTSLALVVIATTTVAIAALSVFFRWRTWVQQSSDWRSDTFSEPEACNHCHSSWRTARLFTACAPSDSKLEPNHSFWRSDAAYEHAESLACSRLEAHLLAFAGTQSYAPRWRRRPPVANRTGTVALDFEYLRHLRPLGSDRSWLSSNYVFAVQSCGCGAVHYLNVTRHDSDDDGIRSNGIIRGARVTGEEIQKSRDLDPNPPRAIRHSRWRTLIGL